MSDSAAARNVSWLVNRFAQEVAGVAHAAVISSDGLLLARSDTLPAEPAYQLSAITSGLWGLAIGTATCLEGGDVNQTMVEMESGIVFLTAISDGSILVVLAARPCNLGTIGYEMGRLVTRVGHLLTPELRHELYAAGNEVHP